MERGEVKIFHFENWKNEKRDVIDKLLNKWRSKGVPNFQTATTVKIAGFRSKRPVRWRHIFTFREALDLLGHFQMSGLRGSPHGGTPTFPLNPHDVAPLLRERHVLPCELCSLSWFMIGPCVCPTFVFAFSAVDLLWNHWFRLCALTLLTWA